MNNGSNLVKDNFWIALSETLPELNRDYSAEIIPDPNPDLYRCRAVLTYLTDTGKAAVQVIARRLNEEMINALLATVKNEKARELAKKILGKSQAAVVRVVNGATGEVESEDAESADTIDLSLVETKINDELKPEEQKEPDTPVPPAGKKEEIKPVDIMELQWSGLFKAYMPGPDVEMFYGWIRRLLTAELNNRMVQNKQAVLALPNTFDAKWADNVALENTKAVYVWPSDLVQPTKFRQLVDVLYEHLTESVKIHAPYNGTVKVQMRHHDDDMIAVSAVYMSPKEITGTKGE